MTIRRVFVVLLVVQLFNMGVRETLDPDMWWHLRTGEVIWSDGIPRQDIFSFTVPGHEWITHEWLSEAIMWRVYALLGLPGLSLFFAGLSALAFWLVYKCSDGRPYLAGLLVILASFAAAPSVGVRPQVFSLVLAAAFVNLIEGFRKQGTKGSLFLLPLLMIIWVNLHGGYLLGVVLLATYAVGEAMDLGLKRSAESVLGWSDVRLLAALALICFAVTALNPNGWQLWSYPFGTLGSAIMQENIAEWHSPDFHAYVYWPFAVMMGLGVIAWISADERPSCTDVLLFLGTAAAGLLSSRHIALFAVIATPAIARSVARTMRRTGAYALLPGQQSEAPLSRRKAQLNWGILVVGVAAACVWNAERLQGNETAIAKAYPVAAVEFLQREGLAQERGYNAYVWGGYLIWRGLPVFVDGRADVYGEFLTEYLTTFRLKDDWRKPLDDFAVAYVLVERSNPLGVLLAASGEWREAYADDTARVFTRVRH